MEKESRGPRQPLPPSKPLDLERNRVDPCSVAAYHESAAGEGVLFGASARTLAGPAALPLADPLVCIFIPMPASRYLWCRAYPRCPSFRVASMSTHGPTGDQSASHPLLSVAEARSGRFIDCDARIRGWVRTRRDSKGGFSFVALNDGSCLGNLQAVVPADLSNYLSDVLRASTGSSVILTGRLVASQGGEQAVELQCSSFELVGVADPESFPLQKKRHSLETLRQWGHLRPRTNTIGAVMRVRNRLSFSTHQFFQERGFYYIHTPIITASDAEGAGQMFRVTTIPPEKTSSVGAAEDFFARKTYLTVSGQLEGEIYACALGKVYTFGPTFRAENSNTSRHLAEFWMIEPEAAFHTLLDNMELAEAYLKRLVQDALQDCSEDIAFFEKTYEPGLVGRLEQLLARPFEHMSYSQAIEVLQASGERFENPVQWGVDLQAEHERYLTERHVQGPLILTDYPKEIKSFYMRLNDDQRTVAAMDVLVPGVGEIIGGSQREDRLDVLESRMAELGLRAEDYWWYLDLRRFGSVPHAGFGLGLERMVQYITAMGNIRDVIPFPRYPGHAGF